MIDNLLNIVFRCSHRRLSRPVTPASKPGFPQAETYIVCFDCGKHFAYDLKQMRMGRAISPPAATNLLPESHHTGRRLALVASALSAVFALVRVFGGRKRPRT